MGSVGNSTSKNSLIGTKYTDNNREYEVIDTITMNGEQYYRVKDSSISNNIVQLMTRKDLEETIKRASNNAEIRKLDEEEKARKQREQNTLNEQRKLFGYADTMSGVKLNRVRNTLLKEFNYRGEGIMSRAEHIKMMLDRGGTVTSRAKRNRNGDTTGTTEYIMRYNNSNEFLAITKIEYEFANWLLKNRK